MGIDGFKAGALNIALTLTHRNAELIAVVDADYLVTKNFICDAVKYFSDPKISLVQFPQAYRNTSNSNRGLASEFEHFFLFYMNMSNYNDSVTSTGTLSIYRKSSVQKIGGWQLETITEDAELGLELLLNGFKTRYVHKIVGRGLMPDLISEFRKQRSRWIIGNAQLLKKNFVRIWKNKNLDFGQKLSIYTQLTAWFDFLLLPFVFLPGAALMGLWNENFGAVLALSAANISAYFVSGFIVFVFGFWKKGCRKKDAACAFLVHVGMSWVQSMSCVYGLLTGKAPFIRTNKFKHPVAREPISFFFVLLVLSVVLILTSSLFTGQVINSVFLANYILLFIAYFYLKGQLKSTSNISLRRR